MIEIIGVHDRPLYLVVLEASGIADIDFTAAQALIDVIAHCRGANIRFAIARLESVRARRALERFGVMADLGSDNLFHSVDEAARVLARRPLSEG
jgi:sulfate permease, SulP family